MTKRYHDSLSGDYLTVGEIVDRITNLLEAVDFKPERNLAMTLLEDHISQARANMGGW